MKCEKLIFSACVAFFFAEIGYSMQPPPPPLNLTQLRKLVSEADLIAVGKIARVKKSDSVEGQDTEK